MSDICQLAREALFGLAREPRLREAVREDGRTAQHVAACSDCAGLLRRLAAQRDALASLGALEAPRELEGRVVAATQPGHRQDRAVGQVAGLAEREAPDALLGRIAEGDTTRPALRRAVAASQPAPHVLERLVAEEIADPARTRARRALDWLERHPAPASLDARIARLFTPLGRLGRYARPAGIAAAVLAALLVFPVLRRDPQPAEPTYSFRVVREGSVQDLDPQARRLLDGLTGGALQAEGGPR